MPEKLEQIIAEIVYKGKFEYPNVQPGMMATYSYIENIRAPQSHLSDADLKRLFALEDAKRSLETELLRKKTRTIEPAPMSIRVGILSEYQIEQNIGDINAKIDQLLTRGIRKTIEALVTKILFRDGQWEAYLDGFNAPVSTKVIHASRWSSELPKITGGDSYEINVSRGPYLAENLPFIGKLLTAFRGKIGVNDEKRVLAAVLTSSDLADNPLVYLSNSSSDELYVVRLSDLPKEERSIRDFVQPRLQTPSSKHEDDLLDGGLGRTAHLSEGDRKSESSENTQFKYSSPREIAEYLNTIIRGQDAAVRSISVAVYDHSVRPEGVKKSNVLIIGPTGTGKTELSQQVAKLLGVPFAEAKLSTKSSVGYKGDNLVTVFGELYTSRNNPNINRSVILLDEIDKLAEKHFENAGFGGTLQNELIGWVENADINAPIDLHKTFKVNTKDMLFIGAGAFVGLENIIAKRLIISIPPNGVERVKAIEEIYSQLKADDLERYGLKPELIGRFPVLTYTKPLHTDALIDIMKNGSKSAFNQQIHLLQKGYGISVNVDEGVYKILANAAESLGTGARGLETASNILFQDIKFNIGNLVKGKTSLRITEAVAYERLRRIISS